MLRVYDVRSNVKSNVYLGLRRCHLKTIQISRLFDGVTKVNFSGVFPVGYDIRTGQTRAIETAAKDVKVTRFF